jgi:hypothetical protein
MPALSPPFCDEAKANKKGADPSKVAATKESPPLQTRQVQGLLPGPYRLPVPGGSEEIGGLGCSGSPHVTPIERIGLERNNSDTWASAMGMQHPWNTAGYDASLPQPEPDVNFQERLSAAFNRGLYQAVEPSRRRMCSTAGCTMRAVAPDKRRWKSKSWPRIETISPIGSTWRIACSNASSTAGVR